MSKQLIASRLAEWRDPVKFITGVLVNPETGLPFVLYAEEIEFLRRALTLTPDGRLPFPELVFSAPKKSGKTALAAMIVLYTIVVLGGPYAEAILLANDYDQAQGRVYQAVARIVRASPLLRGAKVGVNRIEFSTGSTIIAVAADYAGAAGANPTISVFDELWAFTSERSHRLWDELVVPPTRKIACRLTVTYSGFEDESDLLVGLYKRGMSGKKIAPDLRATKDGLLMYWTHSLKAPWQTQAWKNQMRASLRPAQFLRMIGNEWVTTESNFIELEKWDACVDSEIRPIIGDKSLSVWIGVDASYKHDSTAIVACAWDKEAKQVRLVKHFVFQPSPDRPLDFEATVERTLLDLHKDFRVKAIFYDPYQLVAVAQRLTRAHLPMFPFNQTVPNLTEASSNLYDLISARNLAVYPDAAMRLSISHAVAVESGRGWRITKSLASHKIDVVIALAQAALGATRQEGRSGVRVMSLNGFLTKSEWRKRAARGPQRAGETRVERIEDGEV